MNLTKCKTRNLIGCFLFDETHCEPSVFVFTLGFIFIFCRFAVHVLYYIIWPAFYPFCLICFTVYFILLIYLLTCFGLCYCQFVLIDYCTAICDTVCDKCKINKLYFLPYLHDRNELTDSSWTDAFFL